MSGDPITIGTISRTPIIIESLDGTPPVINLVGLIQRNGIDGTDGDNGLSAYQIAINNGFVGNEAAWIASLEGSPGAAPDMSGYATIATVAAEYQPVDADLTAISGLTTTSFGRDFLALADQAAGQTKLGLGTAALSTEATLLNRANHTGTQTISTVTGLQTELDAKQAIISLGLWDYWTEAQATSSNMFPWLVGNISSGTINNAPPTSALKGYNPWGSTIRSSATIDSGSRLYQSNPQQYFGAIDQKFTCWLTPTTSFTGTTIRTGFIDTATVADCTDGAYFEMDGSGVVSAKTAAAGTRTTSGTTYALTINTPYVFDVEVNAAGTSVRFRIYAGTSEVAVYDQTITTNIPTSTSNLTGSGIIATSSGGVAADLCVVHRLGQGTLAGFNRARG